MKHLALPVVLLAATACVLTGCASDTGVVAGSSGTQSAATVPGEKVADEPTVVPGGMGNPNASMRW